jgi:hypothetical protein
VLRTDVPSIRPFVAPVDLGPAVRLAEEVAVRRAEEARIIASAERLVAASVAERSYLVRHALR